MVSLLSKLDAVNMMLESVWESPVSTLDVPGIGSVSMAKRILEETSRSVQSRGWTFNSESEFPLAKASDGTIPVPANTLEVDATDRSIDVVQRGTQLYDRKNHSYTFPDITSPLKVEITFQLEFEMLPQVARQFIAVMAARKFKAKHQNEPEEPASAEELEALRNLENQEAQTGDFNMLTDSWSVAHTLQR